MTRPLSLPAPLRIAASFLLVAAGLAMATPAAAQHDGHHTELAPNYSFMEVWRGHFEASARKFVMLAEAMPADLYDWAPGEGVMSVADVFTHIASYNYAYPTENMGHPAPAGVAYDRLQGTVTGKSDVVRILSASMDHVRAVADGMGPMELDDETMLYGDRVGEWAVLLQLVAHMNEHLGQAIAYARVNGVVPPWSQGR